jgi:hypothetical protein
MWRKEEGRWGKKRGKIKSVGKVEGSMGRWREWDKVEGE